MIKRLGAFWLVIALVVLACGGQGATQAPSGGRSPAASTGGGSPAATEEESPAATEEESPAATEEESPAATEEESPAATEEESPAATEEESPAASLPDLTGTTINAMGAFAGPEADAFNASIAAFEEATGADFVYEGTRNFETLINTRVQAGDPPDVAVFPQPGLMRRFADSGDLIALPESVLAGIDSNYGPGWKDFGTAADGNVYGVFHRVNIKSLVFYNKPAFVAAGYTPPTTWDELMALSDQIVADGSTPWCIGIESEASTGWVATDWTEDMLLRTGGPEVYDQWVSHEIPFNDPQVKTAVETWGSIWLDPAKVLGGTNTILTTPFQTAAAPMFDDPPACWLHRQGSFITSLFPDAVKADLDNQVGVFALPAIDPAIGAPVLGGGDQLGMFADRPEVVAFLEYITTGESGRAWAELGGALFPHLDQDLEAYPTEIERSVADILVNAEVFRFDGSDLMPAEVGVGTFWSEMVNYVSGSQDVDTTLNNIEASWPTE